MEWLGPGPSFFWTSGAGRGFNGVGLSGASARLVQYLSVGIGQLSACFVSYKFDFIWGQSQPEHEVIT